MQSPSGSVYCTRSEPGSTPYSAASSAVSDAYVRPAKGVLSTRISPFSVHLSRKSFEASGTEALGGDSERGSAVTGGACSDEETEA